MIAEAVPAPLMARTAAKYEEPETRERFDMTTHQLAASARRQGTTSIHGLASIDEELPAMEDEFASSDEELQSTNEELPSSEDELQSTNEELPSSNDEFEAIDDELLPMEIEL